MSNQKVTKTVMIKGSPQELYNLWSDYEKHPQFSESLKEVKILDDKTTR